MFDFLRKKSNKRCNFASRKNKITNIQNPNIMKATYKKQIASLIEKMESLIEKMEDEQSLLDEKIEAIYEKADEHDRETTSAEDERIERIEEDKEEYEECAEGIRNAIDELTEYADY